MSYLQTEHLNLQEEKLADLPGVDVEKLSALAKILRGLIFATVEAGQSGHPGGSSAKVEQMLALLVSGRFAFDFLDPKNPGRDRVVWSAGHCTPLLHSTQALVYEALKRKGENFQAKDLHAVEAMDLLRFRHFDGPQGHAESIYPLADLCTGASGHGISGAAGLATLYSSCGLKEMKTYVFMGDAECEEGISYEARNIINTLGLKNLVVFLDRNHFGIDGNTDEVVITSYADQWRALGWNVIECDGHNVLAVAHALKKAQEGFSNGSPAVVLAHCIKGKDYGATENSADSHGKPASHEEYVEIMKKLGFNIPGEQGAVDKDIAVVLQALSQDLVDYLSACLAVNKSNLKTAEQLATEMKEALGARPLVSPTAIKRPENLPTELIFTADKPAATRKATQVFFKWLMEQTAFFYAGSGDLAKSILTWDAEQKYGILSRKNLYGRGLRFGIAEQNMAMMSCALTQDILPGGYQAVSVFSSYGVFTSMMANPVRMSLIGNHINPKNKGFFILLAAHDGLETGEDGPTHQGLYWMSLYNAYPGIKVYKPLDANETVEMLFYALEKGEPIALSVARPDTAVFDRTAGIPAARSAVNGAYVFKPYQENGKEKVVLAVCGGQVMANLLEVLEDFTKDYDVKVLAVTSPELFEDLRKNNPEKAQAIFADEERGRVVALHNGWKGFLYPFLLPKDYIDRSIATESYYKSGPPQEVYEVAKLTPQDIKQKIQKALNK
ncbi:MAG: hypothetical protein A2319_03895 [Candidatus Kerfeldbacteria bacterium RIFOXYB2_FULL_38_14]|uniref:Transketolase-like pyrimidine-binding domain-containing protein n=1 Tax=Candidatus Kerfeldbacteria bacterium RIFOXYB2_FULL_38_14 TaxID=1798547 RepID=A0A1G2BGI9_9BACT|nr:MAG: hypothetical protein A2319_03895 [Candidatus Kerfeldbacteria bacterium RIFOXYB2_FULL_38_14]